MNTMNNNAHTDDAPTSTPAAGEAFEAPTPSFADFGVDARIVEALDNQGIVSPFPIQALTLPVALKRHDIIGQAKTGTGKTLGFGLPILCDIANEPHNRADCPLACIIVPTRELAQQVAQDIGLAGSILGTRVTAVFGGRGFQEQIRGLEAGCDVVVGTPGRMLDLMGRGVLQLDHVRTLVLDEADEMLDLGFLPDIERLVSKVPSQRHTMLFSATMPSQIMALARNYMDHPTHIRAQDPHDDSATVTAIRQLAYRCHELNKDEVLARILQARNRGLTIVFSQTKRAAQNINDELLRRGFACATIHGDLQQTSREQALNALRNGDIDVLVATDVAARGIDVEDVTHVINYQCPEDSKTYVHRIGRTGRAGNTGTAITFVDWEDTLRWRLVVKDLGLDDSLKEPTETYHTSPHLYEDLDIPTDAGATLPEDQRVRSGLRQQRGRGGRPRKKTRTTTRTRKGQASSQKNARKDVSSKQSASGAKKKRSRTRTRRNRSQERSS